MLAHTIQDNGYIQQINLSTASETSDTHRETWNWFSSRHLLRNEFSKLFSTKPNNGPPACWANTNTQINSQ